MNFFKSIQVLLLSCAVVLLMVLLVLIFLGSNGLFDLNKRAAEKRELEALKAEQTEKILTLNRQVRRLKSDPEFIENVVRQELGVVGPGEIMVKIGDDPG